MNLCSDGHDEVCYEERKCPVCILINNYGREIEQLNDEIKQLIIERDELLDANEEMTTILDESKLLDTEGKK